MDAFIREGFWILVGFLIGGGSAYIPLSKRISKVREDAVMKVECKELADLRQEPITQAIAVLQGDVSEVKEDMKELRKDFTKIVRYINGRSSSA